MPQETGTRACGANLLDVSDLTVRFDTRQGTITPIEDVSVTIPLRRTVALVGESGCGKTVTALSIMRLLPEPPAHIDRGRILLSPPDPDSADSSTVDLLTLPPRKMQRVRGRHVAMIFQDPLTSLNPVFTVGEQIMETVELHESIGRRDARDRAIERLRRVGIAEPQQNVDAYPHELSGGMRQRVMIAMALCGKPALLIADEPTTALDVTIQKQILELLKTLQRDHGMSILFITHDLGVVNEMADDVYVMYAGRIVEHAPKTTLLTNPLHPYTRGLLNATPRLGASRAVPESIPGRVPDPARFPTGCRFHPRCTHSFARAQESRRETVPSESVLGDRILRRCVERFDGEPSGTPPLEEVAPDHYVACWEIDG